MARDRWASAILFGAAVVALAGCGTGGDAASSSGSTNPPDASTGCDQTLIPYPLPPGTKHLVSPKTPIVPFYQWENNDGYCGEVSMIQAAMNSGAWMSQYAARLLCGASMPKGAGGAAALQSGPDGYCAAHGEPYVYAQLLFACREGCAAADTCLSNARLAHENYATPAGQTGRTAYEAFLSWVKGRVIAGDWVTVGVLWRYGDDDEYDHIVSVTGIGTNHDPSDASYYDDDVLSFDDHGLYTFQDGELADNPAVPPGAGKDAAGCTPFVFSDTFENLARERSEMGKGGKQPYAFALPRAGVADYAFAVKGPLDDDGATLPVVLRITSTRTDGSTNPADPRAGFDYESPFIGTSKSGVSCTNAPPDSWMQTTADVTVSGLVAGDHYNLYEYRFDHVVGLGDAARLAVPTSGFNAQAAMATRAIPFVASGPTRVEAVSFTSAEVVVFRAVRADAP